MSAAERGVTIVADRVAAKIARQAAAEVTVPVGGRVLRSTASRTGRSVEVTVEVEVPLPTPGSPGQMAHLRHHLTERTRHLTGLAIAPAGIRVRKLTHDPTCPKPEAGERAPSTARRPWSQRRPAATALAATVAALSVLLLWAVLQQHFPGIAAPPVKQVKELTQQFANRSLVRPVAVVAAAAGAWLIFLALTPGHRRMLALGCPPQARAQTTRTHAARLVRAAIADVPGLRVRRVRFTPRKVTVRAEATFGTLLDLRNATTEAIARTLETLALARPPKVRLALHDTRNTHAAATGRPAQECADA
ncbi:DUF6286 domain-containing protein [Streptomyces sp. IBSNAI002]|uniref:DUF6286 domain-containing protein n=1 Tax=Streptomyces sp. IBSNAI002 TaxID=3457500 RepID=UPI003FCF4067